MSRTRLTSSTSPWKDRDKREGETSTTGSPCHHPENLLMTQGVVSLLLELVTHDRPWGFSSPTSWFFGFFFFSAETETKFGCWGKWWNLENERSCDRLTPQLALNLEVKYIDTIFVAGGFFHGGMWVSVPSPTRVCTCTVILASAQRFPNDLLPIQDRLLFMVQWPQLRHPF